MKPGSTYFSFFIDHQDVQIAQKFAECCSLEGPPRHLYRHMMKSNKKRHSSDTTAYQNVRKSVQQIFRIPSTSLSIIESHPEVSQFFTEFQPELDEIISTTPKTPNWLSQRVPRGFWDDTRNQRNFLEWVAIQRGFKTHEDWYQLTQKDVISLGGAGLLKKHNRSFIKALQEVYPEKKWNLYLFQQVPPGHWNDINNQRSFFEWVASQKGFRTHEDWYQLTYNDVISLGGAGLLDKYRGSLTKALQEVFPEKKWDLYLFQKVPSGYWEDINNQRNFLEWVASQRGFKTHQDWYQLTYDDVTSLGGRGLLDKYDGSFIKALQTLFPEKTWHTFLFHKTPPGYWDSIDNQRKYLEWFAKEMDIKDVQDWDRVTIDDMLEHHAGGVLNRHGNSPLRLFSAVYPQVDWKPIFGRSMYIYKNKAQKMLLQRVKYLFPEDEVLFNYKNPEMKFAKSGRAMELDIYVPSKNLAFEYQGEHHFGPVHYSEQPLSVYKLRDDEKRSAVKNAGITLIEVPYWWDKSAQSLAGTITKKRPDILFPHVFHSQEDTIVIPEEPAPSRTSQVDLMLAQTWSKKSLADPTGWWMSEKYDGIRAYWDGTKFISRNFLPLEIPKEITDKMPRCALDGEIWFGHSTIQESMKVVQRSKKITWENFKYMIFDCPLQGGPFEERLEWLQKMIPETQVPFLKLIPFIKCTGSQHLQEYLGSVLSRGGEGVMLRKPGSLYVSGRSGTLLKVKPYKDDEAVIISTSSSDFVQGVTCKLPNSIVFPSQLQSGVQMDLLQVGAVVQFAHSGYFMNGRPRRPRIVKRRPDVTQDQLLINTHRYTVTKSSQEASNCFACNKVLPVGTLKITTTLTEKSTTNDQVTTSRAIDLCPEINCIQQANVSGAVPPFKGTVVVPTYTEQSMEHQDWNHLNNLPGVTVVCTNSFFSTKQQVV